MLEATFETRLMILAFQEPTLERNFMPESFAETFVLLKAASLRSESCCTRQLNVNPKKSYYYRTYLSFE